MMDQKTSFSGSVERAVVPSGGGAPKEKRTLRVSARHQFLPRWLFLFGATYIQDEDETFSGTDQREYLSLQPTVRWRVARNIDLSTSYRYRREESDSAPKADSNAVFLTFTYRAKPWTWSR